MVQKQSIPWLERTSGMLGYFAGAPIDDNSREFVMVTLLRDLAAPKSFVGKSLQTPVVTEDEAPLVEEMFAHHYTRLTRGSAVGIGRIERRNYASITRTMRPAGRPVSNSVSASFTR
jgi:hypothetical protein